MTHAVSVDLAGRGYEVVIGRDLIEDAGRRLKPLLRRAFVVVVMDETVRDLWGDALLDGLALEGVRAETIVIPPGEQEKSFAGLESVCDRLLALGVERGDLIVAFGGGVVGDLAGFAAAVVKRGVDFVQIPTTLLAQVDSSVGGKTAIDTPRGKNLIGAFHQPRLVLADLAALDTLPERELVCGLSEVIKYGLLGDAGFFDWLEAKTPALLTRDEAALKGAIIRSVEMKAAIVAQDEREGGVRALLNLGHTFGHAIEAETGFSDALKHGEAVGLGCALAFRFSAALGHCTFAEAERVERALAALGLPTRLQAVVDAPFAADELLAHMRQDKKASGGEITLVLARGIGEAFVVAGVDPERLRAFLIAEGAAP